MTMVMKNIQLMGQNLSDKMAKDAIVTMGMSTDIPVGPGYREPCTSFKNTMAK